MVAFKKNQIFSLDVAAFAAKAKLNTNLVMRKVAFDMGSRVIMRTPVDTGRARANWMLGIGGINVMTTESTDDAVSVNSAGLGSSRAKNNLQQGLESFDATTGKSIFITNSLPYIGPLEYGHSKQAPGGMVRLTLGEFAVVLAGAVKEVNR